MKRSATRFTRRMTGLITLCYCVSIPGLTGCMALEEPEPVLRFPSGAAERYFYFSRPEGDARLPDKLRARDRLVGLIDGARERIEVWCYGLDEPELIAALVRARARGVELTMTGDADHAYEEALAAGLNIPRRRRSGLQHVKLVLVDRRVLFAGTGNFTTSGFFYNNNGFFHLELDGLSAERVSRALTYESEDVRVPTLPFDGRLYFAPRQGRLIQNRIVRAILNAKRSIRFMIFSHTDPVITAALYNQARAGVSVSGLYDDEFSRFAFDADTEGGRLNAAAGSLPIALYLDGNFSEFEKRPGEFHGGHQHHKTLIIDGERVLTGSYNWSMSARDKNLETLFDFSDPRVAAVFDGEYERLRARSLIQPRAIHPPPPRGASPLLVTSDFGDDRFYCPSVHDDGHTDFTVFAGRGPYFRALRFSGREDPSASGVRATPFGERPCYEHDGAATQSAGLPKSPDYSLSLPESRRDTGPWREARAYTYGLAFARGKARPDGLPCEQEHCPPVILRELRTDEGYLWISASAANPDAFTSMRVWSRAGFSAAVPLRLVASGFYTFTPFDAGGDMLVFLNDASDATRLGCVQSGTAMDATPRYVRDYLAAEGGLPVSCALQ